MDDKERQELIETIKTRVEVWDDPYNFEDKMLDVTLENGNKFDLMSVEIIHNDIYTDVQVNLYDEFTGECNCYAQHLTDESLQMLADNLPLTHTIFVTAHTENSEQSFCVCSVPVPCTWQVADELEHWLKKNFHALDWEPDDVLSFVCYTEFNNHTGPYLLAELNLSE